MKTWNETDARKAWWPRWRETDYTWDGLAGKLLYGWSVRTTGKLVRIEAAPKSARPATLQDLWRSEAGRLHTDAWPRAKLERGASFENLDTLDINLSDVVFSDKLEMKGAGIKGRSDFARAHFIKSAYFNGAALGATTSPLSSAFKESRFDSFCRFPGMRSD